MIQHPTVRYNNTVSDNAHQHVVFHVLSTYTLETQGTAYTKTNTHACAHTHIYTHKMNKSGPLTACLKQLLQCLTSPLQVLPVSTLSVLLLHFKIQPTTGINRI